MSKEPVIGRKTRAVGRPHKLTVSETLKVYEAFTKYIEAEDDPTVVGFVANDKVAVSYRVTRENIYDWPEFSPLVKRAIDKQEAFLIRNGGSGKYNPTMAIFRLKQPQHGYTDKTQTENSGEQKIIIEKRTYAGRSKH